VRISEIVVCLVLCLGRAHTANGQFSVRSAYFLVLIARTEFFVVALVAPNKALFGRPSGNFKCPEPFSFLFGGIATTLFPRRIDY
jgi:hypothetical protein